ncbi:hypothetical protein GA0070558_1689 [Micromonospora haikouensis]|uniref:Uncharacterized protein n=1 Tax=Micromonospora haikouensis TaxID=686309 RepID=A0A1C4YRJ8_9ACTN|nr:hypothetical protein GA0070558_1689 [Micromonospora haikouensis]
MTTKGCPLLTDPTARGLWLAIATLTAVIVGATAGLLAWAGGLNPPTAILTAGGAFAGTMLLFLTIVRFTAGQAE